MCCPQLKETTMRVKHVSDGQGEFDLGFEVVRRAVLTLRRFREVLGRPSSGEFCSVSYSEWLEFYTPLCSRGAGQNGGVK